MRHSKISASAPTNDTQARAYFAKTSPFLIAYFVPMYVPIVPPNERSEGGIDQQVALQSKAAPATDARDVTIQSATKSFL